MKRALLLLLVLGAAAAGDETARPRKVIEEFRLKKDTAPMRGWILDWNDQGFRFEYLGGRGRRDVRWDDLVAEDARRLRIGFGLELTEDEKLGLVPGHEVHFKGGGSVRGILVSTDEDGTHRVRTEGLVLPYPGDRVDRVDEVKVREEEAYSPEEIYVRRLQRRPPQKAEEHKRLADYLFDIGNWEDADREYRAAIEKDSLLEAGLAERLAELDDYREDKAAAGFFAKQKSDAVLNGKWSESIEAIEAYAEQNEGARRRAARLLEDLEEKWLEKKRARFHRVKNEEFDRAIRRYLVRKQPDLASARSWVTSQLRDEVERRIKRRLDVSPDELEMFLESKPQGAPHWATYANGSFVISRRAHTGKSSRKKIRGDPEAWWSQYNQVSTRSTWLKAYAAERIEIFEIVRIITRDCEKCGGTGQVKKMSVNALSDGRHEWSEICPRCFGARQDRSVGYR